MEDWIHNYVLESNAIENIKDKKGAPEYDNHVLATTYVFSESKNNKIVSAKKIHSILMKDVLDRSCTGKYRLCNVSIGGNSTPSPILVVSLMENFERKVKDFIMGKEEEKKKSLKIPLDARCMNFHHHFESIHPFIDGNGRTGRLILNNLRLLQGMEWHTVQSDWDLRDRYYRSIQDWRRVFFDAEMKALVKS